MTIADAREAVSNNRVYSAREWRAMLAELLKILDQQKVVIDALLAPPVSSEERRKKVDAEYAAILVNKP